MRVIAGRYRVLGELGRGGMGAVLEVEHTGLPGRLLAVKVLRPEHREDPGLVERVRREARAAAAIDHPGIVRVTDIEEDPVLGPILVMERLVGESLQQRIERAPMSPAEVRWVAQQALGCLAAAHEAGVVHRDIKPSNLFIERANNGPRLRLLDFGIAAVRGSELTQPGEFVGTLRFASPEQVTGEPAGPQTDLYSLGTTLVALLGQRWSVRRALAGDALDVPLPVGWDAWLVRATAPEAADRYPTAAAMALDLALIPGSAEPPGLTESPVEGFVSAPFFEDYATAQDATRLAPVHPRKAVWPAVLAGVGLLATLGALGWWWSRPTLDGLCQEVADSLVAGQRESGGFSGLPQTASQAWDTAQQLTALKHSSCAEVDPARLDRASEALTEQRSSSGWTLGDDHPAAVPTAWSVLAGAEGAPDDLLAFRNDDGGFAAFEGDPSHAYATTLAAWALKDEGALDWLEEHPRRTADTPGLDEQRGWVLARAGRPTEGTLERVLQRVEHDVYPDGTVDLSRSDGTYGAAQTLGMPWAIQFLRTVDEARARAALRTLEGRWARDRGSLLAEPAYRLAEVLLALE